MDTLFWTKYNPDIQVGKVTRRFYGVYFYKLELSLPGANMLRHPDVPFDVQLERRKNLERNFNWGGSWYPRKHTAPTMTDLTFLEKIRDLRPQWDNRVKFRVEGAFMQVYAKKDADLQKFVAEADPENTYANYFVKISLPESAQAEKLLSKGYSIKHKPFEFAYKIALRDGRYSYETKQQLLNYLVSLGDEVYVPASLTDNLNKTFTSLWGGYFYTRHKGTVTMISMISPGIVREVEEYRELPDN